MSKLSKQDRRRADFAEHIATECADDPPEGADDREGGGDPFEDGPTANPQPYQRPVIAFEEGKGPIIAYTILPSGNSQAIEIVKPAGISIDSLVDRVCLPTISQCDETILMIEDRIGILKAEATRIRAIKRHLLALDKCGMLFAPET